MDKNVIKVYNNENGMFFRQNLVDVTLRRGWGIDQAKKYYLILEIAIADSKDRLLFIALSDSYPVVYIG